MENNTNRTMNKITRHSGFTLVESVVAIGIFTFVIVGIIGLLSASLERQKLAGFETRAALIAQQAIARIRAADNPNSIAFTRGEGKNLDKLFQIHDFTSTSRIVFGYMGTGTATGAVLEDANWASDTINPSPALENNDDLKNIITKALVTLQDSDNDGLYNLTVEVTEPANLPYSARSLKATFSTLAAF